MGQVAVEDNAAFLAAVLPHLVEELRKQGAVGRCRLARFRLRVLQPRGDQRRDNLGIARDNAGPERFRRHLQQPFGRKVQFLYRAEFPGREPEQERMPEFQGMAENLVGIVQVDPGVEIFALPGKIKEAGITKRYNADDFDSCAKLIINDVKNFKFKDYYSVLDIPYIKENLKKDNLNDIIKKYNNDEMRMKFLPSKKIINQIQDNLLSCFPYKIDREIINKYQASFSQ